MQYCPKCQDSGIPGYFADRGQWVECPNHRQDQKKGLLSQVLKSYNFPVKYENYNISEYHGSKSKKNLDTLNKVLEEPKEFIEQGYNLYLTGTNNTQKTSVACYFLKNMIIRGFSGYYLTMRGLYDKITSDMFDEDDTSLDSVKECDLLMVDDSFDIKKLYISSKSTFSESIIDDFFRYREQHNKSNVFISNVTKSDINPSFGEGVRTLLNRNCVELFFEDVIPVNMMNERILKYLKIG